MEKVIKNNRGITLMALVITIIIMMIIASIAVYEGIEIVGRSKTQTMQTNMLTIKAKAKAYSEEIEAKVWALKDGDGEKQKEGKRTAEFRSKGLQRENSSSTEYEVTTNGLKEMGIENNTDGKYYVVFSSDYKEIDVEYRKNGETINKLSDIEKELTEDESESEDESDDGE